MSFLLRGHAMTTQLTRRMAIMATPIRTPIRLRLVGLPPNLCPTSFEEHGPGNVDALLDRDELFGNADADVVEVADVVEGRNQRAGTTMPPTY